MCAGPLVVITNMPEGILPSVCVTVNSVLGVLGVVVLTQYPSMLIGPFLGDPNSILPFTTREMSTRRCLMCSGVVFVKACSTFMSWRPFLL